MPGGERAQHHGDAPAGRTNPRTVSSEGALRPAADAFVTREMRDGQRVQRRDGARRGLGAVVVFLEPKQNCRILAGRAEPAALLVVPELLVLLCLQSEGPLEPLRVAASLEQFEQSPDEIGVI